jgi:hypothetical protein
MPSIPGKLKLASKVEVQVRRAQVVDPQLARAIRRTCQSNRCIGACYLLDVRKPDTEDIHLMIALTLDDEASNMDSVAQQFQKMLEQFPNQAPKTWIMSSAKYVERFRGTEFYLKTKVC